MGCISRLRFPLLTPSPLLPFVCHSDKTISFLASNFWRTIHVTPRQLQSFVSHFAKPSTSFMRGWLSSSGGSGMPLLMRLRRKLPQRTSYLASGGTSWGSKCLDQDGSELILSGSSEAFQQAKR